MQRKHYYHHRQERSIRQCQVVRFVYNTTQTAQVRTMAYVNTDIFSLPISQHNQFFFISRLIKFEILTSLFHIKSINWFSVFYHLDLLRARGWASRINIWNKSIIALIKSLWIENWTTIGSFHALSGPVFVLLVSRWSFTQFHNLFTIELRSIWSIICF